MRSRSRSRYFGASSQGNASVIWRANHSAVGFDVYLPINVDKVFGTHSDPRVVYQACAYDYWSSSSFGDCREYKSASLIGKAKFVPDFFILDPTTVLKRFQ